MKKNTTKIDRALTPDEIREITAECDARNNRSSTPPEEWRAVAEGDGWTLCKIDTLPDMYALLDNVADPLLLYRDDIPDQLGEEDAIAAGYGPVKATDEGDYELVAIVHDDGHADTSVSLYVGEAADGHHDLIASDSSSMWVVGNEDNAELNRDHWDTIAEHCDVAPVLAEVRKIDADLADWLTDRYNEARRTVVIYKGDSLRYDGYNDGVVVAPAENLDADTIKAIWDDLPNECILEIGLGDDKEFTHFRPFDGDGDSRGDSRTIEGWADCKAAYYTAPWNAEDGDGDCDRWELYNADGTVYDGMSIGDRFPPCHNPELRWVPGDYESLHIESGLVPLSDGEETVCKFADIGDFCERAGDCSPDTFLTDAEWDKVLRSMVEA